MRLVACLTLATLSLSPALAAADTFPWHAEFTAGSSTGLAAIHESLYATHQTGLRSVSVENEVWELEDLRLVMESGTLFLEPPVEGTTVVGFFEGKGRITFQPGAPAAEANMSVRMGVPGLKDVPVSSATLFSLDGDSPVARLAGSAPPAGSLPSQLEVYQADKSALRQLGLRTVHLFLNRGSVARGAAMILAPLESIRTPGSEEARILYIFDPTVHHSVSFSVFGHEELAEKKPFKNRFRQVAAYPSRTAPPPVVDVDRYAMEISLGTGAESAREAATVHFRPVAGLRSARLDMSVRMEITEVRDGEGEPLEFLQWKELRTHPDFDQTVVVALDGAGGVPGGPFTMTFRSQGVLFEPWLGSFVLVNEDNWFPNFDVNDDAQFQVELTIPKDLTGIGVGERVSEEVTGREKTLLYRTTQPSKNTTFYFGDYVVEKGKADDITVELFQDRRNIQQLKNADFMVTEISNALKVFNRLFVPLDIDSLRVTPTRMSHGRGFEGLLLMGGGGTQVTSSSRADLFRAHEVAHQWWGHYVRPRSWPEDRWLSEAFAEYAAMEYYRIRFEDESKARDFMKSDWLDPLAEGSHTKESLSGEKEEILGRTVYPLCSGTANVYTKGPLVLHALRYIFRLQKQNDDAFWAMLRDFLATYKYQFVSTADFRAVAEKHFGADLGWFFDQWVRDGGLPVLKWRYDLVEDAGKHVLTLHAEQLQKSYRLVVPVFMHFGGDKMVVRPWLIEGQSAEKTFRLPARPVKVSLNDSLEAPVILRDGSPGRGERRGTGPGPGLSPRP